MITQEQVIDALRYVEDPDLRKDLITLNMVKDIVIEGNKVNFTVVLTTPACPMKTMIQNACINAIKHYVSMDAEVDVLMTASVTTKRGEQRSLLPQVKNIIAVASGKGGVGKSTVASNLAVALAKNGASVGLVDADIYGPSAHIMFGIKTEVPEIKQIEGKNFMVPVEQYGVKVLSIGMLVDPQSAVAWRGPMASKALQQLFTDALWGELDYMIIDLPPGTGDIHLTLVSSVPVTGAIVVSTPQNVALADARKGIAMFQMDSVKVPVLGIVENMAWFTPAELPNNQYFIFGKDGAKDLADKLELPLLGQIPIVQSICEGGDSGKPIVLDQSSIVAQSFMTLAEQVAQQIAIRNASQEPTQKVETQY